MEQHRAKNTTDKKDIILRVKCYVPNLNNPKPNLKYWKFNYPKAGKVGGFRVDPTKGELFVGSGVL